MIRRFEQREFFLFTQREHARIAAELVSQAGNDRFLSPVRRDSLRHAASLHDAGWDATDAEPLLSPQRYPLDCLEAGWAMQIEALAASTRRLRDEPRSDPWATLLVSIHGMQLADDFGKVSAGPRRFESSDMRRLFEVNKYQQTEIELQESLRPTLGLAIDHARRLGLSQDLADPRERELAIDYRWLALCDLISMSLLATDVVVQPMPGVTEKGGATSPIAARRVGTKLVLAPWPFADSRITLRAEFRRYPAAPTRSAPELQYALEQLARESLELLLVPN